MTRALLSLAPLLGLVVVLSGCPKQEPPVASGDATGSGEASSPPPTESPETGPAEESVRPSTEGTPQTEALPPGPAPTTTLPDGTVVELAVSPEGRVQQVDASGYPQFDTSGNPIWAPTRQELAYQLFEEAVMLRKGVAGRPPDLISAASKLQEALELKPYFEEARYNLGLVWLAMNFYEDARTVLMKVVAARPDMAEARLALGMTYERMGDLRNAEISYSRGLQKAPEHPGLLNGRARVWLKKGRNQDAEKAAKAILKIDSNSIDAFNTLGLAYMELEQYERAKFAFMKATRLPGGDRSASVVTNLGLVKMRMGKEFEAREHFSEALELDPAAASAKVNLAHIMLKNLDYEGARGLLEDAARALPGNIPVKLNLAVALGGTGEVDRAQTLYEEIAADPESEYRADAILNLAILQGDSLRDYASAIQSYEEYIALMEEQGEEVAEDDVVRKYLKEVRKLKKKQDRKRQREADAAREAAEEESSESEEEAP